MEHNYCHGDDCYDDGDSIGRNVAFANTPERETSAFEKEKILRAVEAQVTVHDVTVTSFIHSDHPPKAKPK